MNNSPACACIAIDQDSPTPLYKCLLLIIMMKKQVSSPCDIFDTIYFPSSPESSPHPHRSHNHSFLFNNNQKAHFESGLNPVGCWSQFFKNLLTLFVSEIIRYIQRQRQRLSWSLKRWHQVRQSQRHSQYP